MDKRTPRPIFVSILIGALCIYSANLLWENHSLSRRHRNLLEESRTLQKTLEMVQSNYHVLMAGMENREKDREGLSETVQSLKKQNETLTFQIQKVESQISSVKEEKSYLEEMLINKTKQIDILKSRTGDTESASSETGGEVQGSIREKDEELRKLNEQNKILQEKLDRLFRTTNDKIHEINVAKIALAETVSTAQKKIEDEWNTVNLGAVTTSAMASPEPQQEIAREPKSEGHVLAVNTEHGFVVIDLGKVDNLSTDAMLEVRKNGAIIATLSVLEIRDVMAACNVKDMQDGQRIEINDPVSILR
jgi:myosin heavy subunit